MAKIVMFGNMKGGIGKSTATLLAATALSQKPFNRKVIVLDLDRQGSLSELRELDKDDTNKFSYEIKACSVKQFYDLDKVGFFNKYDLVFLDSGGKLDNNLAYSEQEIGKLLLKTDVLLVPFVAGNFGTDATLKYLQYVSKIRQANKTMQIVSFVNMHIKNRKEDEQLNSYLEEIASETGLRFLVNKLGFYSAYRGADTIKSLYKAKPNNSQERNFKMWIRELDKTL